MAVMRARYRPGDVGPLSFVNVTGFFVGTGDGVAVTRFLYKPGDVGPVCFVNFTGLLLPVAVGDGDGDASARMKLGAAPPARGISASSASMATPNVVARTNRSILIGPCTFLGRPAFAPPFLKRGALPLCAVSDPWSDSD